MQVLFEQASALDKNDRHTFLREQCGEDSELLGALRSLLAADDRGDGFLDGPLPEASCREEPGEGPRIGPYRLLGELGEGGMSTVYLAEGEEPRRQVALKVIRRGMESAETRRRLQVERQILARLEHPRIARLYDSGTTEDGLPYFVMERIEGLPIDAYCEKHDLPLHQRIELFLKVCTAVWFAHQRLVIHRDLKPGNVLVDAAGEPKLLDFGIAKPLRPETPGGGPEPTAAWLRMLTPHYASPEQVRGETVTTASDVYSLGVLLHRLLTDALPHHLEGLSPTEMERVLQQAPPNRPSERARDPRMKHELRGDLDTILLHSLQPDPERRYGSVEALTEDLDRYLCGFPVRARPDTLIYRTGKFLRRNVVAVATAGLLTLLLVGGSLALARQATTLAAQASDLRLERDRLREVVRFTEQVFKVAGEGEKLTVREAVDRSARMLERKLLTAPEIRGTLQHTIGKIFLNLGAPFAAREQLEQAVELRRSTFGKKSLEAAESLSALGVALVQIATSRAEALAALDEAQEAVSAYRQRQGNAHPSLVTPLNNLVAVLCQLGDYERAQAPAAEALALARRHPGGDRLGLANALTHHALLASHQSNHAAAVATYLETLDLLRHELGERHPETSIVHSNLATAYERLGERGHAENHMRRAVALERQLYRPHNSNLAASIWKLGSLLAKGNAIDEALTLLRESLEMLHALDEPPPASRFALFSSSYSRALIHAGRPAQAEALLRDELASWREELRGHPLLAQAEGLLGESLAHQGRFQEAEPLLLTSHAALREDRGRRARDRAKQARQRLIDLYEAWGRDEEAARHRESKP